MLQRIWSYKEKIFDKNRTKQTDQMMRDILRHADPLWRDWRSTNARLLDPRNQDTMKKRRAGVVHELGPPHDKMDGVAVKDGGNRVKDGRTLLKRPKSSAKEL